MIRPIEHLLLCNSSNFNTNLINVFPKWPNMFFPKIFRIRKELSGRKSITVVKSKNDKNIFGVESSIAGNRNFFFFYKQLK